MIDSRVSRSEAAQQMEETAQHRIIIRYRDDVASGWRFVLKERELVIVTLVDPDQSRRFLSCLCEEAAR
jgi:SPP1 family predicted phage head-tail adaptor